MLCYTKFKSVKFLNSLGIVPVSWLVVRDLY